MLSIAAGGEWTVMVFGAEKCHRGNRFCLPVEAVGIRDRMDPCRFGERLEGVLVSQRSRAGSHPSGIGCGRDSRAF